MTGWPEQTLTWRMSAALAIACGLSTALCFGIGDYLAQRVTRAHGYFAAIFAVQLLAFVLLCGIALAWHGLPSADAQAGAWRLLAAIGLVNTLGLVGLYRAFEQGKLALVSPIAASMGAFSVAFAWLSGSPPALVLAPGLAAVVLGIVAASVLVEPPGDRGRPRLRRALGVGWALVSAVAFGWVFFMIGPSSELLGPAWVVAGLRAVAIAVLLVLARSLRVELGPTLSELWARSRGRVLAAAALDTGGMLIFAFGTSRDLAPAEIAVVAVLASCFPVVTIAFAHSKLGESLRVWQWAGVVAVIVGVAWLSAWS
jgi:drug/metabolite transporter (DMT)-like permease